MDTSTGFPTGVFVFDFSHVGCQRTHQVWVDEHIAGPFFGGCMCTRWAWMSHSTLRKMRNGKMLRNVLPDGWLAVQLSMSDAEKKMKVITKARCIFGLLTSATCT